MIELNDDNDPLLFAASLPNGILICQYMEVVVTIQAGCPTGVEPTTEMVVQAIRKASRTPDVAALANNEWLVAAWHRMTRALEASGKI
jgi:hypothetical protein